MIDVLVTGDYIPVKPWQRIPARGTAVQGVRLYEDGEHLGRVCRPLTYVMEPDGDSLRIWFERAKEQSA